MRKRRKRPPRSGTTSGRPPEASDLKEQLKQFSLDQLIEIVEKFLARLGERQRLEFLNLLPSVRSKDLESQLPYRPFGSPLSDRQEGL